MPNNATNSRGRFVVIEGIDGAGKSLQTKALQRYLTEQGMACIATREPGGSNLGDHLRAWLLQHKTDAITEALLFNAARREHARTLIAPALKQGTWVVSDRFALSGFAYQAAGGADPSALEDLHRIALNSLEEDRLEIKVDLGFLLDLPPIEAQARWDNKEGEIENNENNKENMGDPFERRGLAFFERVRAFLKQRAEKEGQAWHIVDARAEKQEVARQIRETVDHCLFAKTHAKIPVLPRAKVHAQPHAKVSR